VTASTAGCCQLCGSAGATTYVEPAGTWCSRCVPVLWRSDGNPMVAPKCVHCGAPGGIPHGRRGPAVCREHAPAWLRTYLAGER
jgi:hypothetical protein